MNILLFTDWGKNSFAQNDNHYISELKSNGHNIKVIKTSDYDYDLNRANNAIITEAETNNYQLFFTWHDATAIYIETIKKLKNLGVKTLLICGDNLVRPYDHKTICKHFDLVWLTAQETMHLFKKWGANCVFLPYASNPNNYYYIEQEKYIDRVCFVGTAYGSRINMINTLINNGVKVDLYEAKTLPNHVMKVKPDVVKTIINYLRFKEGRKIFKSALINKYFKPEELDVNNPNLTRIEEYTHIEKMREIYSGYKLCLSSSSAYNTWVLKHPLQIVNLRTFEIPSCGGAQLIQRTPELEQYFKDGKDVIFYDNKKDMAKIASSYLSKTDDEIKKIKINARQNIIDNHTWTRRFDYCFELLGLK